MRRYRISTPISSMYAQCSVTAECTSEYLFGETVEGIDDQSEPEKPWVQVRATRDNYTGYMQLSDLQNAPPDTWQTTHWVKQRSTLVFAGPSIKDPVLYRLPFLARVIAERLKDTPFMALHTSGYIWAEHLLAKHELMPANALDIAQTHFLGTPYLWGGCTPAGVDCSGLVQALAVAKGKHLPRDSGDQEHAIDHTVEFQHRQRGDLVYWPGHVGILSDTHTLLHATAHSLSCIQESLAVVEKRAGAISSIKRFFKD